MFFKDDRCKTVSISSKLNIRSFFRKQKALKKILQFRYPSTYLHSNEQNNGTYSVVVAYNSKGAVMLLLL